MHTYTDNIYDFISKFNNSNANQININDIIFDNVILIVSKDGNDTLCISSKYTLDIRGKISIDDINYMSFFDKFNAENKNMIVYHNLQN